MFVIPGKYPSGISVANIGKLMAMFFIKIWSAINSLFQFMKYDFLLTTKEAWDPAPASGLERITNAVYDNIIVDIFNQPFVGSVIKVTTILSAGFILLRFGLTIFQTHFLNVDNNAAAPTLDYFKRVFYVMILVLSAPTMMASGLAIATQLGGAAGTFIMDQAEDQADANNNPPQGNAQTYEFNFYRYNQYYGISAMTWCDSGDGSVFEDQKDEPKKFKPELGVAATLHADSDDELPLRGKYKDDEYFADTSHIKKEKDAYKDLCGEGKPTVLGNMVSVGADKLLAFSYNDISIASIITCITASLFTLAVVLMTVQRIADLITALLMIWYYAQAYVSELKSNAIAQFIKRIFAICMTQFFTITIFSVFNATVLYSKRSLIMAMFELALYNVVKNGASTISDITQPSGTGQQILGASQSIRNLLR